LRLALASGALAAAALAAASIALGPAGLVNPLEALSGGGGLAEYRAVRTAALVALGASLGAAGAAMQQALRNPLVDPYIVGLSAGASLGVVTAVAAGVAWPPLIHAAALAGGLGGFGLVLATAALAGLTGYSLIVVGVAYSYILSSASIFVMTLAPERIPSAFMWLLGSAAYIERDLMAAALPLAAAGLASIAALSRRLEVMGLGDEYAEG
jgi:iron complex transport system permease protein